MTKVKSKNFVYVGAIYRWFSVLYLKQMKHFGQKVNQTKSNHETDHFPPFFYLDFTHFILAGEKYFVCVFYFVIWFGEKKSPNRSRHQNVTKVPAFSSYFDIRKMIPPKNNALENGRFFLVEPLSDVVFLFVDSLSFASPPRFWESRFHAIISLSEKGDQKIYKVCWGKIWTIFSPIISPGSERTTEYLYHLKARQ